jgi:ParB family transcriptional regulator, chromosome partitioning protein
MSAQLNVSVIRSVPLSELFLSSMNVRKGDAEEGIPELAESIFAEGVLQNLVGYEEPLDDSKKTRKEVVAGGRRWRALQLLLREGRISADYPVPFNIKSRGSAIAISLAENNDRLALSPADEFQAAKAMLEEGLSIEEIAARLRIEPIRVQRRLQLANVAPEFIEAYRANKGITLEHLMAFAITDDHDRQRKVWKGLPPAQRDAYYLKRLLMETEICATNPLVRYVTLKAYEKAGGRVRKDFFSEEDGVFLLDRPLLIDLAKAKLDKRAAKVRKEKPAWLHVHVGELDRQTLAAYDRVHMIRRDMTDEESSQLQAIANEIERLRGAPDTVGPDREVERDAALERLAELEQARSALHDATLVVPPEQAAKAGVIVGLDREGKVQIERGLLRPEDAKLFAEQERRVTKANTPKLKQQHSAALVQRLTTERTIALRAAFLEKPEIALAAIVDRLLRNTFEAFQERDSNALEITGPGRELDDSVSSNNAARAFLEERQQHWASKLESCEGTRFDAILRLSLAEKLELLAFGASRTLIAVQTTEGPSRADPLAKELGFDLRRWWSPTADNYFSCVPKETILCAARECLPVEQVAPLGLLKKSELAKRAGALLGGSGWLPDFLRADRVWSAEPEEAEIGSDEEDEELSDEDDAVGTE